MKTDKTRVFNMDCMDYMRSVEDGYFELAVVDPPYGGNDAIGMKDNKTMTKQAAKRSSYRLFSNVAPDVPYWEELFRISKRQIVWGVNFYNNWDFSGGRIVWDKKGTTFGRAELAYYSHSKSVQIYEFEWNGMIQGDMKNKEIRLHPTQKPVKLYEWILMNYAKEGDKILDTHLGIQSSRIAAYNLGFDFTGLELDIEYFDDGNNRFNTHKSQLTLF